jgi:Bacterial Ig-like domain
MKKIALFVAFLGIILVLASCRTDPPSVAKATINSFTATPPSLPAGGGSVTLNWDVKDATKLSIDAGVGEVTGSSKTVSVTSSKTFTLTAESKGGLVTKPAEVTVQGGADTTPPTVVSVSPANGEKGVKSDATIVISFSEKMDRVSTQAGYQSADLPAGGVTFSWNDESTILTIKPNAPLVYAAGDKPATLVAKSYAFSLTNTAKDASGNALAEVSSSFSTLRQLYVEVPSQPTLNGTVSSNGDLGLGSSTGIINVGDDTNKTGARGFVSFDLSAIQSGAIIKDVQLRLNKLNVVNTPYELLDCTPTQVQFCPVFAPLNLEHVSYGPSLEAADYNAGFLSELGFFDTMSTPLGHVKKDVTAAVSDDLSNRDARGSRSQYRLLFSLQTNKDAKADYVTFNGSNGDLQKAPYLFINYLIP